MSARLVVLISGTGSNLAALLEALPNSGIDASVVAVGSDKNAEGLTHAHTHGIPTFEVPLGDYDSRDSWGVALGDEVARHQPDWIVLSGFMRLLPPSTVRRFAGRVLNTHPAYLPEFPGATAVADALRAGVTETGASVIEVDEGVDTGPILARERVPILPGDTEATLHDRIKLVERRLLLDVLRPLVSNSKKAQA